MSEAYIFSNYMVWEELGMKDFRRSNKWVNLRKKYKTPFEKEVLDYMELLEQQIITVEQAVHALTTKDADDCK